MSLLLLALLVAQAGQPSGEAAAKTEPEYQTISVRGRIVWLRDEFEKDGVPLAAEVAKGQLVLRDAGGNLHPLLEDRRGHAFRLDPRLRANEVELLVRRFARHPYLQVLKVYEFDKKGVKYELVYWCEICAITMFELKPCDCCQGKIELQRREVER
jgi:hypothetical protein